MTAGMQTLFDAGYVHGQSLGFSGVRPAGAARENDTQQGGKFDETGMHATRRLRRGVIHRQPIYDVGCLV